MDARKKRNIPQRKTIYLFFIPQISYLRLLSTSIIYNNNINYTIVIIIIMIVIIISSSGSSSLETTLDNAQDYS